MELEKKLKIYALISFLGMVMMIVAYVSPGWGVIEVVGRKRFPTGSMPQDGEPVFMAKRETRRHHHHHHHHHDDRDTVKIHMGLWYFVMCSKLQPEPPAKDFVIEEEEKIDNNGLEVDVSIEEKPERRHGHDHRRCNCKAKTYFKELGPQSMDSAMLEQVLSVKNIGKYGSCEYRVMASIGLTLGMIGFVFSLVYKRRMAQTRRSGLAAFVCLLISGVLHLVCVGKIISAMHVYRAILPNLFTESNSVFLDIHCPWGLILGAVSGILLLISATGHLCVLTRNRSDECRVYRLHLGQTEKQTFPTIAPPGYDASVGLKVPLTSAMEEADALPEKQKM